MQNTIGMHTQKKLLFLYTIFLWCTKEMEEMLPAWKH